MSKCSVTLVGRPIKLDIHEKYARFGLIVDEYLFEGGKIVTKPQYHNCVILGEKSVEKFKKVVNEKDLVIFTDGSILYSEKNGKYYTNIKLNNFTLLSRFEPETKTQAGDPPPEIPSLPNEDDDLPF